MIAQADLNPVTGSGGATGVGSVAAPAGVFMITRFNCQKGLAQKWRIDGH